MRRCGNCGFYQKKTRRQGHCDIYPKVVIKKDGSIRHCYCKVQRTDQCELFIEKRLTLKK